MKVVIFLGPSLPLADARRLLDAIYLPPAKQSDLLSAVGIYEPDVIGLLDGEFGQSMSVWHKEILFALERGIPVYGASSMGALRAVETAAFGTIGVGEIYRMYASGELTDDDEVALAHGLDEIGYRALSEPMVNIRATLRAAREAGDLTADEEQRFIARAKALFYPDRSFARLVQLLREAGEPAQVVQRLERAIATHYIDLKRRDAIELLTTIRDLPAPVWRPSAPFSLARSHTFQTLYQRDRCVRHDGVDVPLAAIANYAALHVPDFHEVNVHALNRALVGMLADMLEVTVTDADVDEEIQRFNLRHRLLTDDQRAGWRKRNDLDAGEFRAFIREIALARALHRWLVTRKYMERTVKFVLDELRHRGQYEAIACKAAAQEEILARRVPFFSQTSYGELTTEQLVIDHLHSTPCRMDTSYYEWADEAGFHNVEDMRIELLRARLAREQAAVAAAELLTESPAPAEAHVA